MRFRILLLHFVACAILLHAAFPEPVSAQQPAPPALTDQLRQESTDRLLQDIRQSGDAARGAILFASRETNCAVCHNNAGTDRVAPDLRQLSPQTTDEALLESILYPSRTIAKGYELTIVQTRQGLVIPLRVIDEQDGILSGRQAVQPWSRLRIALQDIEDRQLSSVSAMPEALPDRLQSRQQFLDLMRYLQQLRDLQSEPFALTAAGVSRAVPRQVSAAALFDRLQCRTCHSDASWQTVSNGSVTPDRAPLLSNVGERLRPDYLQRYLQDPHTAKPGSRMPNLLADESPAVRERIAVQLTHYLLSRSPDALQTAESDGERAHRGFELFHRVGCVACHAPRSEDGEEQSDSAAVPLGNLSERFGLTALVSFLEDPTSIRAAGRMPSLQLSHDEAEDLAHFLCAAAPADRDAFSVNAELAAAGEVQYQRLKCASCHEPEQQSAAPLIPVTDAVGGCLSEAPGPWPLYTLTADQRQLLSEFILPQEPLQPQPILTAMTTLRCYSCHERDGIGGVAPEHDEYFQTADFNLGPQGRIPPRLTGVGDKLQPRWLREVLVSGKSVRPYLQTRMPRFGIPQVESLVELLTAADDQPDRVYQEIADRDRREPREAGHLLAGNQGLNCIACHTFQRQPAATMSAVDLTEMTERLQRDWFVDYLLQPQRLSPGTVMPSFWPGGRAIRQQVLDGNTEKQLEALWIYLEQGREARAPQGLIQESLELLATDQAVMLRRSWPGVGKRGIGVGYPEQVNLVFDAEQMRLAMIWKGRFADPGGVWRSQGHGTARPLGTDIIRSGIGPDLTDPERPWTETESSRRPPGFRFRGYELDPQRRPRLRYQSDDVTVEEYFRGTDDQRLLRSLTLAGTSLSSPRRFRILSGPEITQLSDTEWRSSEGLTVMLPAANRPVVTISKNADVQELHLQLPAGNPELHLELVYSW